MVNNRILIIISYIVIAIVANIFILFAMLFFGVSDWIATLSSATVLTILNVDFIDKF